MKDKIRKSLLLITLALVFMLLIGCLIARHKHTERFTACMIRPRITPGPGPAPGPAPGPQESDVLPNEGYDYEHVRIEYDDLMKNKFERPFVIRNDYGFLHVTVDSTPSAKCSKQIMRLKFLNPSFVAPEGRKQFELSEDMKRAAYPQATRWKAEWTGEPAPGGYAERNPASPPFYLKYMPTGQYVTKVRENCEPYLYLDNNKVTKWFFWAGDIIKEYNSNIRNTDNNLDIFTETVPRTVLQNGPAPFDSILTSWQKGGNDYRHFSFYYG